MSSKELVVRSEAELELMRQQQEEFAGDTVQTPVLKVCQSLTKEVQDDEAEPGDFFNTLTNESLGNEVEFIIAYYNKGRSARQKDTGRYFVAFGQTIPESWEDLVGEDWVGSRFDEHPDAEEVYKKRVNGGDLKEKGWGHGPLISTTYNYTGFVVVQPPEGDDSEPELQPVRLALQRSNKKAADKIGTLLRTMLRGKPTYDKTFILSTEKVKFNSGPSYVVRAAIGRDTTADERLESLKLAQAVTTGRVQEVGETDEAAAEAAKPATPEGAVGI